MQTAGGIIVGGGFKISQVAIITTPAAGPSLASSSPIKGRVDHDSQQPGSETHCDRQNQPSPENALSIDS